MNKEFWTEENKDCISGELPFPEGGRWSQSLDEYNITAFTTSDINELSLDIMGNPASLVKAEDGSYEALNKSFGNGNVTGLKVVWNRISAHNNGKIFVIDWREGYGGKQTLYWNDYFKFYIEPYRENQWKEDNNPFTKEGKHFNFIMALTKNPDGLYNVIGTKPDYWPEGGPWQIELTTPGSEELDYDIECPAPTTQVPAAGSDKECIKETIKCCGDPYIVTLSNELYKMDNFNGNCRLLQGKLNNKDLIINGFMKIVNDHEAKEALEYTINLIKNFNINIDTSKYSIHDFNKEAFFRTLYIKYDNKDIKIDMEKLFVLNNNSNFNLSYSNDISCCILDNSEFDFYKSSDNNSLIINIENQVDIIVSTYSNLQIRTGVYITNPHNIKNTSGPLVKPLNKENYIIPRIGFNKIMNMNTSDSIKLGEKIEQFSNNDSDIIKKIDIY